MPLHFYALLLEYEVKLMCFFFCNRKGGIPWTSWFENSKVTNSSNPHICMIVIEKPWPNAYIDHSFPTECRGKSTSKTNPSYSKSKPTYFSLLVHVLVFIYSTSAIKAQAHDVVLVERMDIDPPMPKKLNHDTYPSSLEIDWWGRQ